MEPSGLSGLRNCLAPPQCITKPAPPVFFSPRAGLRPRKPCRPHRLAVRHGRQRLGVVATIFMACGVPDVLVMVLLGPVTTIIR